MDFSSVLRKDKERSRVFTEAFKYSRDGVRLSKER